MRIDAEGLAGVDQAHEQGVRLAALLGADEYPVLAPTARRSACLQRLLSISLTRRRRRTDSEPPTG